MTEYRQKISVPSSGVLARAAGRVGWRALDPRLTARLRVEQARDTALSAPLPPGVVAVVGPVRHSGRSTVAALLALALARHHGPRVLAVQAAGGDGLHRRLAAGPGGSTQAVLGALGVRAGSPVRPGTVGQRWLREQLTLGPGPLLLAADPVARDEPLTDTEYLPASTALARWCPTQVVDTPPLTTDPVVPAVLARADQVVIVVPDGPACSGQAADCRRWIAPLLRAPAERVVVEVRVCRVEAGRRGRDADDHLVLSDDPALRDGGLLRWSLLGYDTQKMILLLASRLVDRMRQR